MDTVYRKIKREDFWFNNWLRKNLPPGSEGTTITDIDFIVHDYKKRKVAMVEIKQGGKKMPFAQSQTYRLLSRWMKYAAPADGYDYIGFFFICFEHTNFHDGRVTCNGKICQAEDIRKLLTFEPESVTYYGR